MQEDQKEIEQKIRDFEAKNKQVMLVYSGDGGIVSRWREAIAKKKMILPVRNYARCDKHKDLFNDIVNNPEKLQKDQYALKLTTHPLLRVEQKDNKIDDKALSEIVIQSKDITVALRFDVYVNGKCYFQNVISTGAILATAFGSTGYFKSVSRAIFRDGFGLAFIAPTVGISNLILRDTDKVMLKFVRSAEVEIAADKEIHAFNAKVGDEISFDLTSDKVPIIGLEGFHCKECRKNRNSTIISDQYII